MQNPKLLILDEPTAVLTPQEADQLFVVLERLKSEGRAILYISHKLDEVKRLCDTATILRGGKKVATCDPRQETAASLARMMVGADIGEVKAAFRPRRVAPPRLVVQELSLEPDDPHGTRLEEISLEVRGGEIVGIAGVAGNGQDELFAALSGERPAPATAPSSSTAGGRPARRHRTAPHGRRLRAGGAAWPRHRAAHEALGKRVAHRPCGERHGARRASSTSGRRSPQSTARPRAFDVRKAKRDPEAASLSGGNLQKFVVGREILREPGVLVVSQPTWGVDAGAAATIRQALIDLAGRGAAVLVISQDLDELAEIADRIAVMFHGTPVGAARRGGGDARKARIADGRRQRRKRGRRARGKTCSWCLSGAPSARR